MSYLRIAFEGPDKLGKTTQALLLADELGCAYVKYPQEDEFGGRRCREILDGDHAFEPASFQALQVMNRLLTMPRNDILGERAGAVVYDRYKLSGMVYGVSDGLPVEWCEKLTGLLPDVDITFVFVGSPYGEDDDVYGGKQEKIHQLYNELTDWSVCVPINANRPEDVIHREILSHVFECLHTRQWVDQVCLNNGHPAVRR